MDELTLTREDYNFLRQLCLSEVTRAMDRRDAAVAEKLEYTAIGAQKYASRCNELALKLNFMVHGADKE